jgi:hypothetical protein
VPDTSSIAASALPSALAAGHEQFCPQCGYSLRGHGGPDGAAEVCCPECGFAVDLRTLHRSIIPWVHRREIGRWRAYWRTVRLVSRRPRLVAAEASKPLRIEDAEGFRRVTAVLAFVPLAALLVWGYTAAVAAHARIDFSLWSGLGISFSKGAGPLLTREHALGWVLEWAVVVALLLGLWLFLMGVTGVASYFFHPRQLDVVQQNRAVALSYFSSAALAWTPVSVAILVLGIACGQVRASNWQSAQYLRNVAVVATVTGGVMLLGQAGIWYTDTLAMLRRASYGSWGRVATAALLLPILSLLLGVLTLVILPAAVALIALMILSFS